MPIGDKLDKLKALGKKAGFPEITGALDKIADIFDKGAGAQHEKAEGEDPLVDKLREITLSVNVIKEKQNEQNELIAHLISCIAELPTLVETCLKQNSNSDTDEEK